MQQLPQPANQPTQSASRSKEQQPTPRNIRSLVPPTEPEGRRYTQFFNHGFKPIHAKPSEPGKKPEWYTNNDQTHPLELRVLWKLVKSEDIYIGIRFGSKTNYFLIDIDSTSPYHPYRSEADFKKILEELESLGVGNPVPIHSSWSEGIHLYYAFPEPLETFKVALAVKKCLVDAGFKQRSGWLEIFPNPKPFSKNRITDYNAHALPLQAGRGSILLQIKNWPIGSEVIPAGLDLGQEYNAHAVKCFNNLMEKSAATCKLNKLKKKLEQAYADRNKYQERHNDLVLSAQAAEWKSDLECMITDGFTGNGQTNWLLHKIGVLGLVFEHFEGEDLINYMYEQVTNAPGYKEYCRHQHEIVSRCKEWAKCISSTGYYCKYRGFPDRTLMNYSRMFSQVSNGTNCDPNPKPAKSNPHNKHQALLSTEKIKQAIIELQQEGRYPLGKAARMFAIIGKTNELYGKGVSRRTLYRKENHSLWNPEFEIPDPWELPEIQTPAQELADALATRKQEIPEPTIAGLLPQALNSQPVTILTELWKPYTVAFLTYPIRKVTTFQSLESAQGGISHLNFAYEGLKSGLRLCSPLKGAKASRHGENLEKSAFQPLGGIQLSSEGNYGLWSFIGVTGKTLECKFHLNQLPPKTEPPKPQGDAPGGDERSGKNHQHQQGDEQTPLPNEEAYQPGVTILAYGVYWKVIEKVGASAAHLVVENSNRQRNVFYNYLELARIGLIKLVAPERPSQPPPETPSPPPIDESSNEFVEWYTKAVERGLIQKVLDYKHLPKVNYQGQQVYAVFVIYKDAFGRPKTAIKPWLEVRDKYKYL